MPEYDFSGKVAFVTGAARGMGESIAREYAKNGADVVVTDIGHDVDSAPFELGTESGLHETADLVEDEGQEALALGMDVRDEANVEAAVDEAVDHFGRIDMLANSAGISGQADAVEMEEEQWDDMLDTNLKGVWLCSKHVGQQFMDQGDGGKIVSTSSTAGLSGIPGEAHYVAAKHGVVGLTKGMAIELAEHDVNVNCICPGVVNTPMIDGLVNAYGEDALAGIGEVTGPFNLFDPEDPGFEPIEVSHAYMWLSSDASNLVTGHALPVDGGWTIK